MTSYSSLAGCDLKCFFSIPEKKDTIIEWANLQTISISSARTVVQVRGLGTSKPLGITRGARTFAGSLVFSTIEKDYLYEALKAIGKEDTLESWFYDALPPFNITIRGANEYGDYLTQILYEVVLTNWGSTYSVDDLMTEQTYTYVASQVSPIYVEEFKRFNFVPEGATDISVETLLGRPA